MIEPLLELQTVSREYAAGEGSVAALRDVTLTIQSGEWLAIMGPSGSGKSTLMNILGCLDRPTAGAYCVAGRDVADFNSDECAAIRRTRFGFIFQRYNLLSSLSALANVEVPAVYAGQDVHARHARAAALLEQLGLADRTHHHPHQLSGGQQQRVSIARALMNGGEIILADEPTGALDSHAGEEVLQILKNLHAQGHAIILVTHDATVAARAERVITLADGAIVSDRRLSISIPISVHAGPAKTSSPSGSSRAERVGALRESILAAMGALRAHRLRSGLAMLGIIIGIASVVSVVALGLGGRQKVLNDIRALGTNTLDIYPGHGFGDERAMRVRTLIPSDATALGDQSYVQAVSPVVSTSVSLRFGNVSVAGYINGVGDQYFSVHRFEVQHGHIFSSDAIRSLAQVAILDDKAAERLFGRADPIGRVLLIGKMPARIIGVAKRAGASFGGGGALNVWMPYTSVIGRLMGPSALRSITVRVQDETSMDAAANAVTNLLKRRHNAQDFFFFNTDTIRKSVESTTATMTLVVSSIAVISLLVGGIGVMNIMLVSVTERTREIGIRLAVGARARDILEQFLIEAVVVCVIGGALGVLLSLSIGFLVDYLATPIPYAFSSVSMLAALLVSTLIGVTFGFIPARHAARLDPIDALARE